MPNNAGRKAVHDILGHKPGSAGKAVVDLVEGALSANREEVDRLVTEHNARVAAFDERARDFVSRAAHEELQGQVVDIRRRMAAAAVALGGVVEAHNEAISDATPANVEAAQVATDEAEQTGIDIDTRIESLETRVSELEGRVDDHEERISALEVRREPIVVRTPEYPGPEPEPEADGVEVAPRPRQSERAARVAHDANPRNWGNNPLPWILAILGLVLGLIVGWLLFGASNPALWDWVALLFVPVMIVIGFCGGGLIGVRLTEHQAEARRPAEA